MNRDDDEIVTVQLTAKRSVLLRAAVVIEETGDELTPPYGDTKEWAEFKRVYTDAVDDCY